MYKANAKQKVPYQEKLMPLVRERYKEKLRDIAGLDPYQLPKSEWDSDLNRLPPLLNLDLINYLVYSVSYYTQTEFRNYKALESYQQFVEGWVDDLKIYQPRYCANTVIMTKVRKHCIREVLLLLA